MRKKKMHAPKPYLVPGDKVRMTDRYFEGEMYKGKVWTVISEPWPVSDGWLVGLEGFVGGYSCDGLELVE